MLHEFKAVSLVDAEITEEGEITGYGSIFGERDDYGDVVLAGAFKKTLREKRGAPIPMLREHNPREVIGVWTEYVEDDRGLKLKGKIETGVVAGSEARTLVLARALSGLSIGYNTVRADDDEAGRQLKELKLWEVSLVTFPALVSAHIDAVKAAHLSDREIEERLTRGADLSRTVARALMRGGVSAIKSKPGAGDDAVHRMGNSILSDLKAIRS